MSAPAQKLSPAPAATGPVVKRLKKGDLLFAEGENSKAMYLIKSGIIRLYKNKGDTVIELDSVRSGQILGELAFLDGNPRSASGEALMDCELVEISGPSFQETLGKMPEWLKLLLKTVVGRLRTASNRIRQLESASTTYSYSEKDGKRTSQYMYLTPPDVLKSATAVLLVAARNGTPTKDGIEVKIGLLERYGNQVMGVPASKLTSMLDVLVQGGILSYGDENASGSSVFVKDIDFLEQIISYLNDENLIDPSKKHDITIKGFLFMGVLAKHLPKYPADPQTGLSEVNLADIKKAETEATGKEFRTDDFAELVKLGYATNMSVKSATEMMTSIRPDAFLRAFRFQRVCMAVHAVNQQKQKSSGFRR